MQQSAAVVAVAIFVCILLGPVDSAYLKLKYVIDDTESSARWLSIVNQSPLSSTDGYYQHYISQEKAYLRDVKMQVITSRDYKLPPELQNMDLGISCGLLSDQQTLCVWLYNSTSNCLFNAELQVPSSSTLKSSYCFDGFPSWTHLVPQKDDVALATHYYLLSPNYIAVVKTPDALPINFVVIDQVWKSPLQADLIVGAGSTLWEGKQEYLYVARVNSGSYAASELLLFDLTNPNSPTFVKGLVMNIPSREVFMGPQQASQADAAAFGLDLSSQGMTSRASLARFMFSSGIQQTLNATLPAQGIWGANGFSNEPGVKEALFTTGGPSGFVAYSAYLNGTDFRFDDISSFTNISVPYLAKGYNYGYNNFPASQCQDMCVALAGHDPKTGHSKIVMVMHNLNNNCF